MPGLHAVQLAIEQGVRSAQIPLLFSLSLSHKHALTLFDCSFFSVLFVDVADSLFLCCVVAVLAAAYGLGFHAAGAQAIHISCVPLGDYFG